MEIKIKNLLGLCRRSGKCTCGASATEFAIKSGRCRLVFIAHDSGGSTKDKFVHLCTAGNVRYITAYGREELGEAVGYKEKAVVGVTDEGFANGIISAQGKSGN